MFESGWSAVLVSTGFVEGVAAAAIVRVVDAGGFVKVVVAAASVAVAIVGVADVGAALSLVVVAYACGEQTNTTLSYNVHRLLAFSSDWPDWNSRSSHNPSLAKT